MLMEIGRYKRSRALHLASRRPVSCACKKRTERSLRCIPARFRCEAYTFNLTYGSGYFRDDDLLRDLRRLLDDETRRHIVP